MRKNRTTTTPFVGQLLFAEVDAGSIVLDCVLARADSVGVAATPVTLRAAWPSRTSADEVTSVLKEWADQEAEISVEIAEGSHGPTVQIVFESTTVILSPEG